MLANVKNMLLYLIFQRTNLKSIAYCIKLLFKLIT